MASPLRFRYAPGSWSPGRVESELYRPLDANLGAESGRPWFKPPSGYQARRFEMENGDVALFCWGSDDGPEGTDGGPAGYWMGNTETPQRLWKTEKYGFEEVPEPISEWAEKELTAQLHEESPWLEPYPHLSWFFLPVFLSKDGRETTREFFRDHAAGFPDATREEGLAFYESVLSTGALDPYRETMAGKLGTSKQLDLTRMRAAMGEFDAAKLLIDAGYEITPEIPVTTGHSLDYRAEKSGTEPTLVEVTRPLPPSRRAASTPVAAVRDTAETKTSGQLEAHAGGVTLFVDCTSFPDDAWASVLAEKPEVRHRPAVVFRFRPDGRVEGYRKGAALDLGGAI
ncbi:hypothetical protein AArcSl_3002 [Halalkaliarchaeum desulfuricum]|uniref:Uncharacterized protein n=1 Tax=Halalkaliarchaeum desulfuricum TaxID=2055893 RepID=A0A343TNE1_9EURY|nr:DUF5784 family protein [Halalkaliarchaeum desulfuricum]AUX10613.1 hypothetical protein AArcSl_3002 [Halalkaliarchaeum desulfuricum]